MAGDGVRLIRARDYRRMRWKNGLGETAEVAIEPAGAALDRFDWRVSMARVESSGPFSAFAGIDRTLTVLDGAGFRLAVEGHPVAELTPGSAPFPFPGDRPASATLLAGPVTDLNVMTRRADWWHGVRRLGPDETAAGRTARATALVVCAGRSAIVRTGGTSVELGALDTLLVSDASANIEVAAATAGGLVLVEIGPR